MVHRLVIALSLLAGVAWAGDEVRARQSFDRGMALYAVEHWDEAIREFEAGFIEAPLPSFLFNIAQAHKHAGRPDKAVAYYQKYLDLLPNAPDRAQVEREIAELQARPAPPLPGPRVEAPAPAPAPIRDSPPIYKRWWLWTAVVAVAAIAGAAVAIGVATGSRSNPSTDLGFYPFR